VPPRARRSALLTLLLGACTATSPLDSGRLDTADTAPRDSAPRDSADTAAPDTAAPDTAGDSATDTGSDTQTTCPPGDWIIHAGQVCHQGAPARPVGANGMHVFGPGSADMATWNMTIAREFIGNVRDVPLSGWPIQDENGSWLHPLRDVVDDNRANGIVTILSPMGWDGVDALLGEDPSSVVWYVDYEARLGEIAAEFAGERDVWISLWNEPYTWTGDGFDPDEWLRDQQALIDVVRATGNDSLVLVPGSHMGQGVEVWTTHASRLVDPADGLLFDVHLYERWMVDRTPEQAQADLDALDALGIAWMVGEIAPMNAGTLMDPRLYLSLPAVQARPVTAWLWKYSDTDLDALLTVAGEPNDVGNNAWGSTMRGVAEAQEVPAVIF
jgi:mannan endo-1,4-beta-mannosidase